MNRNDAPEGLGTRLCMLLVEDSQDDAEILIEELRVNGYAVDYLRVDTEQQLRAALPQRPWDVVLCDIVLPQFDAWRALEVVHEWQVDVPFIVVAGSVSEETAILMMKAGAHDFVLKHNLRRLVPAIERELREAAVRAETAALREQLLLSDRLVQVGTLAASVAHEINNPLAYVMGNLEYALHELSSPICSASVPDRVIEALSTAFEGSQRIRATTDDLRVFARTDSTHPHPVDLKRVLESAIGMAGVQIRYRARLIKELEEVPALPANENRLGQVFLNLLVNAAQAIPEGHTADHEIRVRLRCLDKHAEVQISDTGRGIPPEVRKRLFQPFVTTKSKEEGTGLGLSICRRIVHEYRGEISAVANEDRGTTFVVRLPLPLNAASSSWHSMLSSPLHYESPRGRLLVIDDEPEIVDMIRRELRTHHHELVGVTSGRAALALLNRDPAFDVILCDLMMPVINGMQLYAELERTNPSLLKRIVFITGGAFTPAALEFLAKIPNPNITKPFEAEALTKLVRMTLARVAGTRRALGTAS